MAKVAAEAGVRTEFDIVQHAQHCPDCWLGFVPEHTQAVARAAKFIDDVILSDLKQDFNLNQYCRIRELL